MMLVPKSPQPPDGSAASSSQDPYLLMAAATMYKNGNLTEEQKAAKTDFRHPEAQSEPSGEGETMTDASEHAPSETEMKAIQAGKNLKAIGYVGAPGRRKTKFEEEQLAAIEAQEAQTRASRAFEPARRVDPEYVSEGAYRARKRAEELERSRR